MSLFLESFSDCDPLTPSSVNTSLALKFGLYENKLFPYLKSRHSFSIIVTTIKNSPVPYS